MDSCIGPEAKKLAQNAVFRQYGALFYTTSTVGSLLNWLFLDSWTIINRSRGWRERHSTSTHCPFSFWDSLMVNWVGLPLLWVSTIPIFIWGCQFANVYHFTQTSASAAPSSWSFDSIVRLGFMYCVLPLTLESYLIIHEHLFFKTSCHLRQSVKYFLNLGSKSEHSAFFVYRKSISGSSTK